MLSRILRGIITVHLPALVPYQVSNSLFSQAVVRAVVAALTSEEQAINPSLYPPQRRPRPGIESGQDEGGRVERYDTLTFSLLKSADIST